MLNKNIFILLLLQALSSALIALLTFSSALAGRWLVGTTALATLPISATLTGAFVAVCFLASIFQRWGRKRAFRRVFARGCGWGVSRCGIVR